MLLNWTVIWIRLREQSRRRHTSPLDDPLDGPEWRPFLWTVPPVAFLLRRQGAAGVPVRRRDSLRAALRWSRSRAG